MSFLHTPPFGGMVYRTHDGKSTLQGCARLHRQFATPDPQGAPVYGAWYQPSPSRAMSRARRTKRSSCRGSDRKAGAAWEPTPTTVLPLPVISTAEKAPPPSAASLPFSSFTSGSLRAAASMARCSGRC